ncbi:MAG: histidine kinase, partial [Bacteroidota bacterium]
IVNYALWPFLIPFIYHFYRKFPVHNTRKRAVILKAIALSIVIALVHESLSTIVYFIPLHFTGTEEFSANAQLYIKGYFWSAAINRMIEYWIIYAGFAAIDYYKQNRDKQLKLVSLQGQLAQSQLSALKFQLQPHFLFNTLNTISSLMEVDVKDSQKIVSRLGSLLRTVLDQERGNEVFLEEELDFVRNYLDIEQVRFHDRLSISYEIEHQVRDIKVPSLILQPLVENAFKHGFSNRTSEGNIRLTARTEADNMVFIEVCDDGDGSNLPQEALLNQGIGLRNVSERLNLLYGPGNSSLKIQTAPGEGFCISLRIPKQQQ